MRKRSSLKPVGTLASAAALVLFVVLPDVPSRAAPGGVVQTPVQPGELPVEIETEMAPGSLKQAPLWKEFAQLLEDPYGTVERRPGFGVVMPPLNVFPLDYNFLIDEPLRIRTSDGEISWDIPGPLFDPDEVVAVDAFNVPTELRTVIGSLEVDAFDNVVVSNPDGDPRIPPDGTIVAVPAVVDGVLYEAEIDPLTGELEFEEVVELEAPVNENDFIADRAAAEVLGKALFWDMQVGSDGIQACGTCHFHAGVDNRTRNQLNPNHLGGDLTLQVRPANGTLQRNDFPFHRLANPDIVGEPLLNPGNVVRDANDVASSMGVRFRRFRDIRPVGPSSFGPAFNGVAPLLPELNAAEPDPIPAFQNLRRVEPRNTPTMHSAAFNFDNFWDGRARFVFNGGSVFGPSDPYFHVWAGDGTAAGALAGMADPESVLEGEPVPIRIKFSSLASQAVGPPLSDFEMSFAGRRWPKIGKKLLQDGVTPLANQLVATDDSVLGPYSNQGGSECAALGRPTAPAKPGICVSYPELIRMAFIPELWSNTTQHLREVADAADGFDGFHLELFNGAAPPANRARFSQMAANFSLFFGLSIQAYEQLLIPDDSPFDQFMDANPGAQNGVAQPGEQGTLPVLDPALIRELVTGSPTGNLVLVPGFGPEEVFGFDIFAGADLTAVLPTGTARNPAGFGSNPFFRSARCMLCHLGPEQTDHSISISHGILHSGPEYEYPTPPEAAEPAGPFAAVGGLVLAEEITETPQDVVELEPLDMGLVDDPATAWDDRIIAAPRAFAYGDQGIYNIALRPAADDVGRGGDDPFGWPLSVSALAMKNIAGEDFEPCDTPAELLGAGCTGAMANYDPDLGIGGGLFEDVGEGLFFPGTTYELASINPGLDKTPLVPMLPEYLAPWVSDLQAGEAHPQIDELAFMVNTTTPPSGGPVVEFGENLFGSDVHCATYDPAAFGSGPPNFGWGATDPVTGELVVGHCPTARSGVAGNFEPPLHGSWPFPNRVRRDGSFKAPQLRNVELTGPYFHTGSYLTLRQVVDFYMRGGDFPITNAEGRDQNMVDMARQAFGFGRTTGDDLAPFADALPDGAFAYDAMPDTDHPTTPEPENATPEQAKRALVSFLIALTDARVKFERAPFDRPEIFVPVDGRAPFNTGGRAALLADPRFRHVPAVGAGGRPDALRPFLDLASFPIPGQRNDHFDR